MKTAPKEAFNAYFSFILSKVLTAHKYLQPYSLERLQHDYDAKIASSSILHLKSC